MKASERLAKRNEILEMIKQLDHELECLGRDRSFRNAGLARAALDERADLGDELRALGFGVPELSLEALEGVQLRAAE